MAPSTTAARLQKILASGVDIQRNMSYITDMRRAIRPAQVGRKATIMSKHTIHGAQVEINVYQGALTEQARGHCVGKVVNLCRALTPEQFALLRRPANSFALSAEGAAIIGRIDAELAANYTKRYADDFAPIASIEFRA